MIYVEARAACCGTANAKIIPRNRIVFLGVVSWVCGKRQSGAWLSQEFYVCISCTMHYVRDRSRYLVVLQLPASG